MKWVTSEWLAADWRANSVLLGEVIAQALTFHNLFFEEGGKNVFSSLFKLQEGCQSIWPLSILKDKPAAKELLSHPDLFLGRQQA